MQLLNEISSGSIALEPKFPELSYFDASRDAIAANLNGVLSRTKSSATIIAPTLMCAQHVVGGVKIKVGEY